MEGKTTHNVARSLVRKSSMAISELSFASVSKRISVVRNEQTEPMADSDLELSGEGAVLFYLSCRLYFLLLFLLFLPKIMGAPEPPGPSPRSATEAKCIFI